MSMQPHFTLVGAALALTVLGCRNERQYDSDETTPPTPITQPGPTEQSPPLDEDEVEGVDVAGEDDQGDRDDDGEPSPPDSIDSGADPKDQQVPEAIIEPGTDPKQAPPPSSSGGKTKRASRG
jgi:hypothetical protein